MSDKIEKKYRMSATGLLSIDEDGLLYINIEDGPQDVSITELVRDFDNKKVDIAVSYSEKYEIQEVDKETGEII